MHSCKKSVRVQFSSRVRRLPVPRAPQFQADGASENQHHVDLVNRIRNFLSSERKRPSELFSLCVVAPVIDSLQLLLYHIYFQYQKISIFIVLIFFSTHTERGKLSCFGSRIWVFSKIALSSLEAPSWGREHWNPIAFPVND